MENRGHMIDFSLLSFLCDSRYILSRARVISESSEVGSELSWILGTEGSDFLIHQPWSMKVEIKLQSDTGVEININY